MLKVRNLEAGYGQLRVLRGLSLHVSAGEIVAIIGANGAGKSTLLNTIAGLVQSTSGSISFKDEELSRLSPEKIVPRGCSLVPEGRKLFPPMTVRENLALGAFIHTGKGKAVIRERLESVYALFPRLSERKDQLAGTLSGGEQQMLAIGRSLMSDPDFIMLDEPSMGLAPLVIRDIFQAVASLRDRGKTVMVVEQNARAILKIADRGYVMETGNLILEGTSTELRSNRDVQRAYLGKDYQSFTNEGEER